MATRILQRSIAPARRRRSRYVEKVIAGRCSTAASSSVATAAFPVEMVDGRKRIWRDRNIRRGATSANRASMVSLVLVAAIRSPEGLAPGPTPTGNPDPACAPTPIRTPTPTPARMPTPTGMTPAPAAAPAAATMPSPATMPTRPVAPRVSGSKIGRSGKSSKRKGSNHQQPACHHTLLFRSPHFDRASRRLPIILLRHHDRRSTRIILCPVSQRVQLLWC